MWLMSAWRKSKIKQKRLKIATQEDPNKVAKSFLNGTLRHSNKLAEILNSNPLNL